MEIWHTKTITETIEKLDSKEHGLNLNDIKIRLQKFGYNKLPEKETDSLIAIFIRQFQSPLIYILLLASAMVLSMGEVTDSLIIFAVLFFNAIVGTIQEGKAQNTLSALKKFVETNATVLREHKEYIIPDKELVPGDIIILQEGEKVPADARVISSNNLKADEAAMTGESEPVYKTNAVLTDPKLQISEQKNIIFKSTNIVAGNGKAIVIATGIETAVGKISQEIAAIDTEIPLKTNIRHLSRLIIIFTAATSAILFVLGVSSGTPAKEMFKTVVSLSVSIIPEGLPIVMTLILAMGVWKMSKQNVLVRRLQAVETLGQANIIAVDKTGTITKNEMIVQKAYIGGKLFEISGNGYEPKGEITLEKNIIDPLIHNELILAGKISAFCSNARVIFSEENKEWKITGDPTEAAMLVFSEKIGFHKNDLGEESPQTAEIPFDYKLKYHASLHILNKKNFLAVTGAPENILKLSKKIWKAGKSHPLSEKEKSNLETIFIQMSQSGFRTVALAKKIIAEKSLTNENIKDLIFVGFLGIKDTLRPEVAEAMKQATAAGIKVIMITGDHKATAEAIAKEAGIYHKNDLIITGDEMEKMTASELKEKLGKASVFARVTPEHKLKIIETYKQQGNIIAMTGDGINDAPSLVAADLGVGMGKIGTEVAKEASDIILLDDNFGSIISAIEEGRNIYKTIKKVILYLFSTSMGEVLTITAAILLGYPLPILATQIIWLNFITDGFLDVSLAMEPKEKGLLQKKFERPKRYIVDSLMAKRMVFVSVTMMIGTLLLFREFFEADINKAWTISLTTLAAFQWFNAWNCRSEDKSIFQIDPFSNKFLLASTIIVVSLQIFAVYSPFMQKILHTAPLSLHEWLIIIGMASTVVIIEETRKFFYRIELKPAKLNFSQRGRGIFGEKE